MTSIAVISNHPFTSATTTTTTTTTTAAAAGTKGRRTNASDHLDFTVCKSEDKTQWTNFHFVMCIGLVSFFVFWIFLLSKMYLPAKFQLFGGGGGGGGDEEGQAANQTLLAVEEEEET